MGSGSPNKMGSKGHETTCDSEKNMNKTQIFKFEF